MIAGIFHEGSGLGDQIFRYITVRTLAEQKKIPWAMLGIGNFKGVSFLPMPDYAIFSEVGYKKWTEKEIRDADKTDIRSYDPEINFVQDNTVVDGSFEDDKYWRKNLKNINEWLKVEPLDIPNNLCLVGFRGGEYAGIPELFLTPDYYDDAMEMMMEKKSDMEFQVHTDDPILAKTYFPGLEIIDNQRISHSKHTNMGLNWRTARFAKYAVIPNSAFFIIPRILKHFEDPEAVTIAPRYWARRNTKTWARPACYYPEFTYA